MLPAQRELQRPVPQRHGLHSRRAQPDARRALVLVLVRRPRRLRAAQHGDQALGGARERRRRRAGARRLRRVRHGVGHEPRAQGGLGRRDGPVRQRRDDLDHVRRADRHAQHQRDEHVPPDRAAAAQRDALSRVHGRERLRPQGAALPLELAHRRVRGAARRQDERRARHPVGVRGRLLLADGRHDRAQGVGRVRQSARARARVGDEADEPPSPPPSLLPGTRRAARTTASRRATSRIRTTRSCARRTRSCTSRRATPTRSSR